MKKVEHKMIPIAILLIGLVMLMESAATMLVLVAAPLQSGTAYIGWMYVLLKAAISLFAIIAGFMSMKK